MGWVGGVLALEVSKTQQFLLADFKEIIDLSLQGCVFWGGASGGQTGSRQIFRHQVYRPSWPEREGGSTGKRNISFTQVMYYSYVLFSESSGRLRTQVGLALRTRESHYWVLERTNHYFLVVPLFLFHILGWEVICILPHISILVIVRADIGNSHSTHI